MNEQLFIVDAFTERPFSGNPAALCLLEGGREAAWMQQLAAEMNLSETAFLSPRAAGEWDLRWFTPKTEVDLCGHATLASAHVLWRELGDPSDRLNFHTRSGVLSAERDDAAIALDFPANPPVPVSDTGVVETLTRALGIRPQWVGRSRDNLVAVLGEPEALRRLTPDMSVLASLAGRGIMVSSLSDDPEYDFVSRFFAPRAGVPEDPVTGSAHCCLGPYWGERLGKSRLRAWQASARGGVIDVVLQGERVRLEGRAVTVLGGRLHAA